MDQQKPDPNIVIREALFPDDKPVVEELFLAYVRQFSEQLGFDLDFQDFAREVANLPGAYARPTGCVLLAKDATNHNIGVVAMRRLNNDTCEMKRMYVDDRARGLGLGRILSEAIINEAQLAGYKNMRLDTLERLMPALNLYRSLGFSEIEQYCANPLPDAVFMELSLVNYLAPISRSIGGLA